MNLLAVFTVCFLSVVVSSAENNGSCPSGWDPSPCVCENKFKARLPTVNCDAATDASQIQKAFASLPQDSKAAFTTFSLSNSEVKTLTSGIFGKASFEFFFITNSKLETVEEDAFKGSEVSAENFLFYNTSIRDFKFQSLRNLENLRNFELSSSQLSAIPDNAFGRKNKLEVLNLGDNKVSSLGKEAFVDLPKVRKIDLTGNRLTELGELSLATPAAQQPVTVLLSHNLISKIHKDAFKGMRLQQMEIEDNKLESLDEEVFRPLLEIVSQTQGSIGTYGNPFKCDKESMKWLLAVREDQRRHLYGFVCRDGRALEELKSSDLP